MITLNGDTAARLNTGMQVGSAVELPFFAPVFFVWNGDARMRGAGGIHYFGGWAVSAEDWQKAPDEWGIEEQPGITRTELVTADQKTLDATRPAPCWLRPFAAA